MRKATMVDHFSLGVSYYSRPGLMFTNLSKLLFVFKNVWMINILIDVGDRLEQTNQKRVTINFYYSTLGW